MTVEEYRQRLIEIFHKTNRDELIALVALPNEEDFKLLESVLTQYKDPWIPCSERMPDENTKVLCSCRAGIYDILHADHYGWHDWIGNAYKKSFVLAWMPLPESYKEG